MSDEYFQLISQSLRGTYVSLQQDHVFGEDQKLI